ncbi:MAG: hypothetical protein KDC07_07090 [Chitinophagaceae bacterium]|nr:hypothetical protein [Chitinophagaceae bacterium]
MPALTKKKKLFLGITAVVILLLIVIGNIVAGRYKKIILNVLPKAVAAGTDSLYHISVQGASLNILTRSITLRGIHIWADSDIVARSIADSTAKPMYVDVNIPRLKVSSIMWDKLKGGEGFSCGLLTIVRPAIAIYKTDSALIKKDTSHRTEQNKEFTANTLKVMNADIRYIFLNGDDSNIVSFNKCDAELSNWQYGLSYLRDTSKFLMADHGEIIVGNFSYASPSSMYNYSCTNLRFSSQENKITARDLRIRLKGTTAEFYRKVDMQKEIYDLNFPTIEFDKIDRNKLKQEHILTSSAVYLNHSSMEILLDRRHPANTISKLGKFPNQVVRNMKLPIYIGEIKINKGSVAYAEISNKTGKKATIHFDNIDGTISNVTNIPAYLEKDSIAIAHLNAKFNKYTDVDALFRFSMSDPKGAFSLDARLEGMQSYQVSEQTKAFSLLDVKSLNMKSLDLKISGNEYAAGGYFTMLYSNLGIRILKNETNQVGEKKTKGFLSFIANNMILYSGNPMPGDDVRHIKTQVKRDELKSFFNLIWQNILEGVRETTIRDMQVIDWIKKNDQQKNGLFSPEKKRKKKRGG